MPTITLPQMIVAAEREVGLRKRVYPRWVLGGRLSQSFADHELACMQAIVEKLKEVQKSEGTSATGALPDANQDQPTLF